MSAPGDPVPPQPPEPVPPVAGPVSETQTQRVARLKKALDEQKKVAARILLHARYAFGYLAAGFLVSVPISLGSKVGYGLTLSEALVETGLSLAYGVVLLVPFFALIPFSRIDWHAMKVPEFQLF